MTIIKREYYLKEDLEELARRLNKLDYYVTDMDDEDLSCIVYNQCKPGGFDVVSDEALGLLIDDNLCIDIYYGCMDFKERVEYLKDQLEYISYEAVYLFTKVEENPHFSDSDGFNAKAGHRTVRRKLDITN